MQSLPQRSMQRNRGKQQNGKTRDLFKKIRGTKGTLHAKMGSIKKYIQKWYGPTEADDIKKNGGKNTQKNCTKKIFMTQIITMV